MPGPFYFAWAGGAIEEQVTVVTNGTTHGVTFETVALVGDVTAGGRQLTNLATNRQLDTGVLYQLAGPGISTGTFFVFDNTILSGLDDSINLSAPATATHKSATFTATKSVSVGVVLGTLVDGDDDVTLTEVGDLPAGTYGVFGTGIGETDVPVGTTSGTTVTTGGGIMVVSSCYLIYDGISSGQLKILAATPHTTTTTDSLGGTRSTTTYTVAVQPVRANAGGTFPLQLDGFPVDDAAIITDIPASALMDLTPGLVYNISGNGIEIGTTFIAPASGATSIELDLPATSSDLNSILTITGPRTPNATFDAAAHNRFDEDIINVEITQDEGGLATLTVDLQNPNVGLLATGRHLWVWLSWDQAWPGGPPDLVPLFNGRLIGVPRLQAGEIVQLEFLARPDDLNSQKLTLSNSLQVLPYYDPVWLSSNVTPDTVLETYSALYHVDRVNLGLTISDILEGEDGIIEIGEDKSIYDKFSLAYGQPPLIACVVSGTVTWQQQAEGLLDVTQRIIDAFHDAGSAYKTAFATGAFRVGGGGLIQTLSGDGLQSDWPKPGTAIGGGWSLTTQNDGSGVPLCYIIDAVVSNKGGWITPATVDIDYAGPAEPAETGDTEDQTTLNIFTQPFGQLTVKFPLNVYKIRMNLDYKADRKRTETVTAVVTAGIQRELSDAAENDRETITMTSDYIDKGIDPAGALPIGDVAYRSYFQTARGASSIEYLLLAARAKIRARARTVDITFAVDWRSALAITLRHSVRYIDRRLPGGVAVGKVKGYKLTAGAGGMLGAFTIGCSIGTGEETTTHEADGFYVDPGYWQPRYAVETGGQTALPTSDIAYETLDNFVIIDDGLDLTNVTDKNAVNTCFVSNGMLTQLPKLKSFHNTVAPVFGSPRQTMRTLTTTVTLDLKPVQGAEFHTDFFPAISQVAIPKTIDLAAPTPGSI